jgi:hypothetical protein
MSAYKMTDFTGCRQRFECSYNFFPRRLFLVFKMSEYIPTAYDEKLEELLQAASKKVKSLYMSGGYAGEWVHRQKLLSAARSPEYVRYLEEKLGLA